MICVTPIPKAVVEGSIKRVNPSEDLRVKLLQTPERDRWEIYKKEGIWYETLVTLAEQIRSDPNNVKLNSEWKELLNSVGLGEVATELLK